FQSQIPEHAGKGFVASIDIACGLPARAGLFRTDVVGGVRIEALLECACRSADGAPRHRRRGARLRTCPSTATGSVAFAIIADRAAKKLVRRQFKPFPLMSHSARSRAPKAWI